MPQLLALLIAVVIPAIFIPAILVRPAPGLLQITLGYRAQQLNAEGIRLMQQDRFADAESQFRQAAQADSSNLDALTNLGVAIFKQGRFAESIPFFEQGVANRLDRATLHNDLAQAYVRDGCGALFRRARWLSNEKVASSCSKQSPKFLDFGL